MRGKIINNLSFVLFHANRSMQLCSVGSTVRIIPPGMLSTVDRQSQPQVQQQTQQTQQIVTSIPATYHVPRGPAAVANISAPRSAVATPIVRACAGQAVPISRPGYEFFIL